MTLINKLITGVLATSLVAPALMAADVSTQPASTTNKKEIEQIIHDYLVSNPEVLIEASQVLQQKQQQNMQKQAQSSIQEHADKLFQGPLTTAGNPKGTVTLVEFFDYQCIHCKKMSPTLTKLIKKDNNVRVIYKEFPIFGKSSERASRAALAAGMQGKYLEMHEALFKLDKRLNDKIIMDTAQSIGLNLSKFKTDMDSQAVTDILEANRALAEQLHLMGTPAFIIAATTDGKLKEGTTPTFIPGAATEDSLQELISKAGAK